MGIAITSPWPDVVTIQVWNNKLIQRVTDAVLQASSSWTRNIDSKLVMSVNILIKHRPRWRFLEFSSPVVSLSKQQNFDERIWQLIQREKKVSGWWNSTRQPDTIPATVTVISQIDCQWWLDFKFGWLPTLTTCPMSNTVMVASNVATQALVFFY